MSALVLGIAVVVGIIVLIFVIGYAIDFWEKHDVGVKLLGIGLLLGGLSVVGAGMSDNSVIFCVIGIVMILLAIPPLKGD